MSEYMGTFDKEFLERTKKIIEESHSEYEFTLLLNCTLALICLPIEKFKKINNNNFEVINLIGEKIKEIEGTTKMWKNNNSYTIKNIFIFNYEKLKEFSFDMIGIYLKYAK